MPCILSRSLPCVYSCPTLYPEVSCTDSHCLAARLVYLSDILKCLTYGSVSLHLETRLVLLYIWEIKLLVSSSSSPLSRLVLPLLPQPSSLLSPWFQWSPSLPVIVSSTVCTVFHISLSLLYPVYTITTHSASESAFLQIRDNISSFLIVSNLARSF